jgi:hypothetical protein
VIPLSNISGKEKEDIIRYFEATEGIWGSGHAIGSVSVRNWQLLFFIGNLPSTGPFYFMIIDEAKVCSFFLKKN